MPEAAISIFTSLIGLVSESLESIVGNGEQAFSPFSKMFLKTCFPGSFKMCGKSIKPDLNCILNELNGENHCGRQNGRK